MKLDQQQQAQHLYFQTDLSKTEIASSLGIGRRTLHQWIRQNNWDTLKKSATFIPSFLAENCYQVLGNYTEYLLSEDRKGEPLTTQEVNNLYRLTLTINKLKNRSTLCESMEMMQWFAEKVFQRDQALAQKMQPHIHEYIESRAAGDRRQHGPAKMQGLGYIPKQDTAEEELERKLDEEDHNAWLKEQAAKQPITPAAQGQPAPASAAAPFKKVADIPTPASSGANTKPQPQTSDLRKMLRGTATTGPSKILRRNQPVAA
jgi:hypothetical protein